MHKQSDQNIINIIDSENCSFLKMEYGLAKDKWIKDDLDNEAIKRMELLKCQ